jgi:methyl-accepting chemotaxis protein
MRWFHDRSTLVKLLGTFTLVCALMLVVGYTGITTAQGITASLDNTENNLLPGTSQLLTTNVNITSVQRDIRGAILEETPAATLQVLNQMDQELAASEQSWAAYKVLPTDTEERALWAPYETGYAAWKADVVDARAQALLNTIESDKLAQDIVVQRAAPKGAALMKALGDLVTVQATASTTANRQAAAQYESSFNLLVGLMIGAIVLALGMGLFVARSLATPLKAMAAAANAIALGDLDQDISLDRKDEVGQAAAGFRRAITYLRGMAEVADAMADGDLTRSVEPHSARDVLGTSFKKMISSLRDLVGQVQESAVSLAETSAQLGSAAAQTGSAVQQVTMAVQNVASGAQETSRSAQETTSAVGQLSQVIDGIARGATDQARQVQTTSATATEMAAGVEEVATNATHMATAGQQTRVVAERGGQAVRETTAAMAEIQSVVGQAAGKVRELGVLGQKIGAVVETIDDIAEQTNLLALNAAIEAARAGEHGKGFAVVADEVRKLAERSGRETKQIAELIAQVQTGTKEAVGAMDNGAAKVELGTEKAAQAGEALEEILAAVQDTVRQVGEIASSSRQMAGGARSVTDAMHSISAVVEESSAATEEMAAQASAVSGSIQSIASVSEQQSAATEQVSASTEEMSAQVEQMAAQAQQLAATVDQLKQLVSRFKLDDYAASAAASARTQAARATSPLRRVA